MISVGIACIIVIISLSTAIFLQGGSKTASGNTKETKDKSNDQTKNQSENQSKNLIVLIGDGMGPAQITLSRIYGQKYHDQTRLALDDYLVGSNSTLADDSSSVGQSGIVTDSAASGTAFATGNKTYNGAISVTNEEVAKPVASVIEAAQEAGKATGLISTARITHATPAVYASHVRDRGNENAIATQYLTSGLDVLLGGGERAFVSDEKSAVFGEAKREDGENLLQSFEENGYTIVNNKSELEEATGDKLLGLFSASHIPYNIDREDNDGVPTLSEQLAKALSIVEKNDNGFVIMVEGGRIDHAGHANDIHSVALETLEFDEAFKTAIEYAEKDGETSVIVTADHETGGLSLGSKNTYDAHFDIIHDVNASSEVIGAALKEAETSEDIKTIVEKYTGINDLTNEEIDLIMSGNLADGHPSSYEREGSFNAVISQRSLFGWTGHGHSGVDVGVYAYGPVVNLLQGFSDNTNIAKSGAQILGLDLAATTEKLQSKYLYPKHVVTEDDEVLLPIESLAKEFGLKVIKKDKEYIIETDDKTVTVDTTSGKIKNDNKTYTMQIKEDKLYVPIDFINDMTKDALQWDTLSERIIIN